MGSTYVQNPPYFDGMTLEPTPVRGTDGRPRAGDVRRQHHHRPHFARRQHQGDSAPGGVYLSEHQVAARDFNSYGARRGNHEVMERGTFANIRIRNEMMGGTEGGNTRLLRRSPNAEGQAMSIFDAAQLYKKDGHATVVIGGKEYGSGSSRDWAAKGPKLLGVRAVISESFERIHRSNLIGMGVAPFCFEAGKTSQGLRLHRPRNDQTFRACPATLMPRQTDGRRWSIAPMARHSTGCRSI